jgi:hypothetical protein
MTAPQIVLRLADSPGLVENARELFRSYDESIGMDLEYQGFSAELAALPAPMSRPMAHCSPFIVGWNSSRSAVQR